MNWVVWQAPLLHVKEGTTVSQLQSRGFELLKVLGKGTFGKAC